LELAFRILDSKLGVPQFMEVDDMVSGKGDSKALATYISTCIEAFNAQPYHRNQRSNSLSSSDSLQALAIALNDADQALLSVYNAATEKESRWKIGAKSSSTADGKEAKSKTSRGRIGGVRKGVLNIFGDSKGKIDTGTSSKQSTNEIEEQQPSSKKSWREKESLNRNISKRGSNKETRANNSGDEEQIREKERDKTNGRWKETTNDRSSSVDDMERRGELDIGTELVGKGQREKELPSSGRMREVLTLKEKKRQRRS